MYSCSSDCGMIYTSVALRNVIWYNICSYLFWELIMNFAVFVFYFSKIRINYSISIFSKFFYLRIYLSHSNRRSSAFHCISPSTFITLFKYVFALLSQSKIFWVIFFEFKICRFKTFEPPFELGIVTITKSWISNECASCNLFSSSLKYRFSYFRSIFCRLWFRFGNLNSYNLSKFNKLFPTHTFDIQLISKLLLFVFWIMFYNISLAVFNNRMDFSKLPVCNSITIIVIFENQTHRHCIFCLFCVSCVLCF